MRTLVIRHIGSHPDKFEVERLEDGKRAPVVEVPPPHGFPVEGRPNSDLMKDLRWYLEDFLQYPFPPDTGVAERVLDALRAWGARAFNALFDNREGGRLFDAATGRCMSGRRGGEELDCQSSLLWGRT